MESLPTWFQWVVSISTVLSSVGVIIAFVQLRISSKQFHQQLQVSTEEFQTQLKLTQDQFKLINQGFVKMTMGQFWLMHGQDLTADPTKPLPLDSTTLYYGGRVKLNLENVGNLPVKTSFKRINICVNDKEVFTAPAELLMQFNDTIHPKTNADYYVANFPFTDPISDLLLTDIALLTITYSILIEYHDYNDSDLRVKTIEREMQLVGGIIYNAHIKDSL